MKGFFPEADVQYPEKLHELTNNDLAIFTRQKKI